MLKRIRNIQSFTKEKRIFCIEGSWNNNHQDKTSVSKALDFFEIIEGVKTILKPCPNKLALKDLINDSMQTKYSKYSILYFAFHGEPNNIFVEKRNKTVSLDEIAEIIDGKANGKIIHFGCCSTLDLKGWDLRRFLFKTNALAVSGYKKDIDFVKSTLFDLLYFQQCQKTKDVRKIQNEMKKYHNTLGKELGFVFYYYK